MIVIQVYMVDGREFSYEVDDIAKAREHAHRIINYGWRNVEKTSTGDEMVYYPIHQILKVKFKVFDNKDYLMNKYESGG